MSSSHPNNNVLALLSCVNDGDTAWMLVSTLLVLGMVPALAFFEGGLLRSKNTLSLISQMFSGAIILSTMWIVIGYSLTFGPNAFASFGLIGDFSSVLWLQGVSYTACSNYAPTIPTAAFASFQMMFATITPLLMTGAFAERLKFKVFIPFIILWEIVVYYPVAHWIWGSGFLSPAAASASSSFSFSVYDYAGGIVIHATAGAGSLVSAIMLGPRRDFHRFQFKGAVPPSNIPMAAIGAALLWMGWFGFNGGSALGSTSVALIAIVSTQIGASISGIIWLVLSWRDGHPSVTHLLNGAIGGMAGITGAAGYIDIPAAIIISVFVGLLSFYGAHLLKEVLYIDDALEVSVVHGFTGIIGAIAVGFAAENRINKEGPNGAFFGNPSQIYHQLIGIIIVVVWSAAWTALILKGLSYCFNGGIRVTAEVEKVGLDFSEHGAVAYHHLHVLREDDNDDDDDDDDDEEVEKDELDSENGKNEQVKENSKNREKKQKRRRRKRQYDDDEDDDISSRVRLPLSRDYCRLPAPKHNHNETLDDKEKEKQSLLESR